MSEEQRGWCLRLKQMQSRAPVLAEMQRSSERRDTTVGVWELRASLAQSQQGVAPVDFWVTKFCHTVVLVILNSVCSILIVSKSTNNNSNTPRHLESLQELKTRYLCTRWAMLMFSWDSQDHFRVGSQLSTSLL